MRSLSNLMSRAATPPPTYQLTDLLHAGHSVRVPETGIVAAVADWLADLGVHSPLADDLGRSVRNGDWATAHAIAQSLSVDVTVATV